MYNVTRLGLQVNGINVSLYDFRDCGCVWVAGTKYIAYDSDLSP